MATTDLDKVKVMNPADSKIPEGPIAEKWTNSKVKGGDYRAREANVYRLAEVSNNIIDQCVAQGVPFAREYGGLLANRSFGGAQVSRTFYAKGQTGQQLLLGAYSSLNRQINLGKRYGNLFDMYEEITDVNPGEKGSEINGQVYYNPMMIFPAIHYTMGGIWVDYELQTSLKGLFAIGECNFSDHGANRLGASALMQGLADGYFVLPYTIQNYLSDQITVPCPGTDGPEFAEAEKKCVEAQNAFLKIQGKRSVDSIHKELGHIMWEYVGMGRTKEGLTLALDKLKALRKEFETNLYVPGTAEGMNNELDKAFRLKDFITMGELVAYDALNRNESCGGHFREEYQTEEGEAKRDDENYFYVACWDYQGSDEKAPELIKEPLHYEAIKVQTRNYKS